ncbi:hypothetical protein ACMU_17680 [Actibacterium mucosum KCTC 23349]|uniref:Uncharacterized protein n=1 Tax=Actibacterium mucosum KCTC 23349 TaxID=1454373 RepID=A0A037ZFZ9_9RHOB|nr:hypothetical protein ACMU_17680 [Actibacterium mucosum KCTC 23349]
MITRTVATYEPPIVEIRCDTCGRHGRYARERFAEIVDPDTPLPEALTRIARHSGCEERRPGAHDMHAPCRPYFVGRA